MSSIDELSSSEVDPGTPPARPWRRRLRFAVMALVLVVTLAGIVVAGSTRTAPDIALPSSIPTAPTSTAPTSTAPTSTAPPIRRVTKLADHPLLLPGETLPDATCNLPAFGRDAESLLPYYEELVRCFDIAWAPVLDAARLPRNLPWVNIQQHPGETGCGDPDKEGEADDFIAMYCSVLDRMYLPLDRILAVDEGRPANHIAVLAHEFAHHVQEESGLLWTATQDMKRAGWTSAQGLEMNRRVELQANCFAGLAIAAVAGHGSISHSLAREAMAFFRAGSSPQTHGSNANQRVWARKGFEQRTTAACNTFAAPAGEVS
jgi:hypothetical protein